MPRRWQVAIVVCRAFYRTAVSPSQAKIRREMGQEGQAMHRMGYMKRLPGIQSQLLRPATPFLVENVPVAGVPIT